MHIHEYSNYNQVSSLKAAITRTCCLLDLPNLLCKSQCLQKRESFNRITIMVAHTLFCGKLKLGHGQYPGSHVRTHPHPCIGSNVQAIHLKGLATTDAISPRVGRAGIENFLPYSALEQASAEICTTAQTFKHEWKVHQSSAAGDTPFMPQRVVRRSLERFVCPEGSGGGRAGLQTVQPTLPTQA